MSGNTPKPLEAPQSGVEYDVIFAVSNSDPSSVSPQGAASAESTGRDRLGEDAGSGWRDMVACLRICIKLQVDRGQKGA